MMKKTTGVTKRWDKTVLLKTAVEVATAASRTGTRTGTCVCEPKAAISSSWLTQRRRRKEKNNRHTIETGNDCFCHVVPFFLFVALLVARFCCLKSHRA